MDGAAVDKKVPQCPVHKYEMYKSECAHCRGDGHRECWECDGGGFCMNFHCHNGWVQCHHCYGTGDGWACEDCDADGQDEEQ